MVALLGWNVRSIERGRLAVGRTRTRRPRFHHGWLAGTVTTSLPVPSWKERKGMRVSGVACAAPHRPIDHESHGGVFCTGRRCRAVHRLPVDIHTIGTLSYGVWFH
jgi:hypothetical protein